MQHNQKNSMKKSATRISRISSCFAHFPNWDFSCFKMQINLKNGTTWADIGPYIKSGKNLQTMMNDEQKKKPSRQKRKKIRPRNSSPFFFQIRVPPTCPPHCPPNSTRKKKEKEHAITSHPHHRPSCFMDPVHCILGWGHGPHQSMAKNLVCADSNHSSLGRVRLIGELGWTPHPPWDQSDTQ